MKFMITSIVAIALIILVAGCTGTSEKDTTMSIVQVGDEVITVDQLLEHPGAVQIVDQIIREKIIRQEFKARKMVMTQEDIDKTWDDLVQKQSQGNEEAFLDMLKQQNVTKEFVLTQMEIQNMIRDMLLEESPISEEEIRADYDANVSRYQRMHQSKHPEIEDWEAITYEDVQDDLYAMQLDRKLSVEGKPFIDNLYNVYNEKGWIKNLLSPESPASLTLIKPIEENPVKPAEPKLIETIDLEPAYPEGHEKEKEEKADDSKAEGEEETPPAEGDDGDSSGSEDKPAEEPSGDGENHEG